jgi:hypothetical protein
VTAKTARANAAQSAKAKVQVVSNVYITGEKVYLRELPQGIEPYAGNL